MNNNDNNDNNTNIALECIGVILLFLSVLMFFAVP